MRRSTRHPRAGQRGAGAVEFALVSVAFFTIFLGIVDLGWVLYQWNTAAEATRLGARTAAVCDLDAAIIKQKVRGLLTTLSANTEVQVIYLPNGCTAATCESITVKVAAGADLANFNPFVPTAVRLPVSTTTLLRESMASVVAGGNNPMCQ